MMQVVADDRKSVGRLSGRYHTCKYWQLLSLPVVSLNLIRKDDSSVLSKVKMEGNAPTLHMLLFFVGGFASHLTNMVVKKSTLRLTHEALPEKCQNPNSFSRARLTPMLPTLFLHPWKYWVSWVRGTGFWEQWSYSPKRHWRDGELQTNAEFNSAASSRKKVAFYREATRRLAFAQYTQTHTSCWSLHLTHWSRRVWNFVSPMPESGWLRLYTKNASLIDSVVQRFGSNVFWPSNATVITSFWLGLCLEHS